MPRKLLRMMAIMQDGSNEELPKEFVEGGRTGRRNAMPDILNAPDTHASTADLPARLQELATSDKVGVESCSSNEVPLIYEYHSEESVGAISVDSRHIPGQVKYCMFGKTAGTDKYSTNTKTCKEKHSKSIKSRSASVDSAGFSSDDDDDQMLSQFLRSGCARRRSAMPEVTPLNTKDIGTTVSDQSFKYCCSEECLMSFLRSKCAQRRKAICLPCPLKICTKDKSCSSVRAKGRSRSCSYPRSAASTIPKLAGKIDFKKHSCCYRNVGSAASAETNECEVIVIDSAKLEEMLGSCCSLCDPKNPQPGPSNPPGSSDKDDAQKSSGS